MASFPFASMTEVARYRVCVNGRALDRASLDRIETITVRQSLSAAWEADIEVLLSAGDDGCWADQDSDFLAPFLRLRIELRVGGGAWVPLFEGATVGSDGLMSAQPSQSTLHLRALDDSTLLARTPADDRSWQKTAASDVAWQIYRQLDTIDPDDDSLIEDTDEALDDRSEITSHGSLLDTLLDLADLTGRIVYVAPSQTAGKSVGAFKTRETADSGLPALVLLGAGRNIEQFDVTDDAVVAASIVGATLSRGDKSVIERRASYMDAPALGDSFAVDSDQAATRRLDPRRAASAYLDDAVRDEAADAGYVVTGHGRVRGGGYPAVLQPDRVITVLGTGERRAGSYYVTDVTHVLGRSEYTQDFEVERNAVSAPASQTPLSGIA